MDIKKQNGTLNVTGPRELNSSNANSFHFAVATALSHDLRSVEIDLAQTQAVDGAGLGALVSLYEKAREHRKRKGFTIRLTNPSPSVQQMLELARLHHLFEIAPPDGERPRAT